MSLMDHHNHEGLVAFLADTAMQLPIPARAGLDVLAAVTALGGLLSILPSITAAAGLVWYCILIYGKIRAWRRGDE